MTVFDALAGAVVGSLMTGVLWFGRYWIIERREGRKLESSLHTELSHMDIFEHLDELPENRIPDPSAFPTVVFDSNADKLGLLKKEYRHSIHAFYSYLEVTKGMIEQEIRNDESDVEMRERIHHNLESLRERRETLLDELEE